MERLWILIRALPNRKEGDIQKAICFYLKTKGYFFWREGNQRRTKDGRHFKSKFEINGKPDIFLFYNGTTIGLEVKTKKGRQSPSQIEFEKLWSHFGLRVYRIVRSVEEVMALGL